MKAAMITLECITNMHVGNGDVNYNIIDNEVEKDPVTGLPTINSSGVKGALRQFFARGDKESANVIKELFGNDNKDSNVSEGSLKIFSADLIAMPARATDGDEPYYMVTTQGALDRYSELRKEFLNKDKNYTEDKLNGAVENIDIKKSVKIDDVAIAVLSEKDIRKISLPVMARNCLENGLSTNLWYEEVVPYKSRFAFIVLSENDKDVETFVNDVNDQVIQFGGEASIGYGFCKVSVEEGKAHE